MSVFIQISEKRAITTDTYAWHIAKPGTYKSKIDGKTKDCWTPIRHYGTLEALINAEVEQSVRDSNAQTYAEVLVEKNNACQRLASLLLGYGYTVSIDGERPDTGNPVNPEQVTRVPVEKGRVQ